MKKIIFYIWLMMCVVTVGCTNDKDTTVIGGADEPTNIIVAESEEKIMYQQISQDEAKKIMDSGEDVVILDVREQYEFDEAHIPGAVLIPHEKIDAQAEELIPDKSRTILVYCRSGRRSKIASEALAKLGYTDVREFGGIIDWKYEVER